MAIHGLISALTTGASLLSIFLLLFSEVFYIKTGFGPVSFFLLLIIPLALTFLFSVGKICFSRLAVVAYLFALVLSFYTFFGILVHGRPTLGIQFLSISLSIFLFINIGYFANRKLIAKLVVAVIAVTLLFAVSQFVFYTIQYGGPFSAFEKISYFVAQSQVDHGVEVLYGRSTGIFTSPNVLGFFGGICFWLIIFLKDEYSVFQYKFGLIASLACLIFSISRGSVAGFIISWFLFFILSAKKINFKKISYGFYLIIVLGGIFYIAYDVFSEDQKERFAELFDVFSGKFEKSENAIGRIDAWVGIAHQMQEMPWGTLLPPQLVINYSPDNQFVYYFAQGGFFLLLIVIIFYLILIFVGMKNKNKDSKILSSIVLFSVVNSLSIVVMNSFVFMLFWMFLGIYSRSSQNNKL